MISRRGFFGALAAVAGAAVVAARTVPSVILRFKGVPVTVNPDCPPSVVYFVNSTNPHRVSRGPLRHDDPAWRHTSTAMGSVYNNCTRGVRT